MPPLADCTERDEVAHTTCAAICSLICFMIHQTVKIRVKDSGKKTICCWIICIEGFKACFHHLSSFLQVCWYLAIDSIGTALLLDLCQEIRPLLVLLKATAQATQIFRDHGRIVELRKCVFICEGHFIPLHSIVSKRSFRLNFEERIWLPSATWKALVLFELLDHLWRLGLWQLPAVWRVFQDFWWLSQAPVKDLCWTFKWFL